eukprot:3933317-Rhodomonas_salina.2
MEPRTLGLLMPWRHTLSGQWADDGAKFVGSLLFLSAFSGLRYHEVLSCEEASCQEHNPARYIRNFVALTRVPVIAAKHVATPIERRHVSAADVAKAFRGGPRPSYSFVEFVEAVGSMHGFPVLSTAQLAEQTWKIANGYPADAYIYTEGFRVLEEALSKQFKLLLEKVGMEATTFNLCGGLSKDAVTVLFAARQCYQASYTWKYLSCCCATGTHTPRVSQYMGQSYAAFQQRTEVLPPAQEIQFLHNWVMDALSAWQGSHPGPDWPRGFLVPVDNGGGGTERFCTVVSTALAVDLCGLKPGLFVRDTMDTPLQEDVYWETTDVKLLGPNTFNVWPLLGPMLQPALHDKGNVEAEPVEGAQYSSLVHEGQQRGPVGLCAVSGKVKDSVHPPRAAGPRHVAIQRHHSNAVLLRVQSGGLDVKC